MKKKNILLGLALAGAALVGLASCGGNNDSSSSSTAAETSSSAASSSETTPASSSSEAQSSSSSEAQPSGSSETQPSTTPASSSSEAQSSSSSEAQPSGSSETQPSTTPTSTAGDPTESSIDYSDYVAISTVEEFMEFRNLEASDKKYVLTADLDFEGVKMEATKVAFRGTLDGNGHSIKNANYVTKDTNKTGFVVATAQNATFRNIKFVGCNASVVAETISLVAGMAGGTCNFEKIEFNSCNVSCNTYVGLLVGRTNGNSAKINISEVTTKNNCSSAVTAYGGFLIGDVTAGKAGANAKITIKNCDIAGKLSGSNANGGFLTGRLRGYTDVEMENIVVRDANIVNNTTTGLFAGGGTGNNSNGTMSVKNVYVLNTNATVVSSSGVKATYENVYVDEASTLAATGITKVAAATANVNWLQETLKLDFSKWVTEGDGTKYRLKAASTNVKSADATISKILISTANVQTRFEQGTDFNSDGLLVFGVYSDGVQLVLAEGVDYEVVKGSFDKTAINDYTITVKSLENAEKTATYTANVVGQTGFRVDSQFAKLTYIKGDTVDLSKAVVYATWSDETENKITKGYTIDLTGLADDDKKVTADAGEYTVKAKMEGFTDVDIKISVLAEKAVAVDNKVTVAVDNSNASLVDGTVIDGNATFKSITAALDYLAASDLGTTVDKVIQVNNGTYHEKITITMANVKIIGESVDNTIIEYDAVESTKDILTGADYGMNCATINANGKGFGLLNITVKNTFNYIRDNKKYSNPQGFALTINEDGAVLDNVHLYGNQDTFYARKGRVYINKSLIEGNVDFIFGEANGIMFFNECTINAVDRQGGSNNGYVTAMKGSTSAKVNYGYVFYKCTFTADDEVAEGSMSLGRPWDQGATVTLIECNLSAAYSKLAYDGTAKSRWADMSGKVPTSADFAEYKSTGAGAITEAVAGGKILTDDQAANYTAANTLANTNGALTWTEDFKYLEELAELNGYIRKLATPVVTKNDETKVASWTAIKSATSYEVYKNGTKVDTITTTSYTLTDTDPGTYAITVKAIGAEGYAVASDLSTEVRFEIIDESAVKLDAPANIAEADATNHTGVITWDAVENATGYLVYVDDADAVAVTAATYTITTSGSHTVKVAATGDNVNYTTSDQSTAATIAVVAKVAAPSISVGAAKVTEVKDGETVIGKMTNPNVISWAAVANAVSYDIYVGETKITTEPITETSYAFEGVAAGTYDVKVVANIGAEDIYNLPNEGTLQVTVKGDVSYFFNDGGAATVGTGYNFNTNVLADGKSPANDSKVVNGSTLTLGGMTIDCTASGAQAAYNKNSNKYNLKTGAVITLNVPANSLTTITFHNGYSNATINGIGTSGTTLNYFSADAGALTIAITGDCYIESIVIQADQTAPAAATISSISVENTPANDVLVGETVDLSGIVVKTNYSDGTFKVVPAANYSLSSIDNTSAGKKTVTVTVTGTEVTGSFDVNYVATINNKINKTTTWSFKDDTSNAGDNYFVYNDAVIGTSYEFSKLTLTGIDPEGNGKYSCANNGDWLKFNTGSTASFEVTGECTLSLTFYQDTNNVQVFLGTETTPITKNADGTYSIEGAGVVTIKAVSNGYIGKITATFDNTIKTTTRIAFGSENTTAYTTNPAVEITATGDDNAENSTMFYGGDIKFKVAAGATVSIMLNYSADFTINGTRTQGLVGNGEGQVAQNFVVVSNAETAQEITISCDTDATGDNYFYWIDITFAE